MPVKPNFKFVKFTSLYDFMELGSDAGNEMYTFEMNNIVSSQSSCFAVLGIG